MLVTMHSAGRPGLKSCCRELCFHSWRSHNLYRDLKTCTSRKHREQWLSCPGVGSAESSFGSGHACQGQANECGCVGLQKMVMVRARESCEDAARLYALRTLSRAHTHINIYTHTHTHTNTNTHVHTQTHTHTHTHTHTRKHTQTHTHTRKHANTHTRGRRW